MGEHGSCKHASSWRRAKRRGAWGRLSLSIAVLALIASSGMAHRSPPSLSGMRLPTFVTSAEATVDSAEVGAVAGGGGGGATDSGHRAGDGFGGTSGRHQNGLLSRSYEGEGWVRALEFTKLRLRTSNLEGDDGSSTFCGIIVEARFNSSVATELHGPGGSPEARALELDCFSAELAAMSRVDVGWADEEMFQSALVPRLAHRSAWSHVAMVRAKRHENASSCSALLRSLEESCNLAIGGQRFTDKTSRVATGIAGRSEAIRGIAAAVAIAQRVTHAAEEASTLVHGRQITIPPNLDAAPAGVRRLRWVDRKRHTDEHHRPGHLHTLRMLAPLWEDAGNVKDMLLVIDGSSSAAGDGGGQGRRDIGTSLAASLGSQGGSGIMSCMELSEMEQTSITLAVSSRLQEKLRTETTFPTFIIRPLMTALLAPISQQIEKKAGPKFGPILAIIFTLAMEVPLCCHLVGLLVHRMGYYLADVLIESLNYKSTDYIIKAVETTLARDISSTMMVAVVRWYTQSVIPEVSNKLADLIPAVLTPGLSAAVSNGVVMAVTKPLTHALKAPVLGYYYCQYCYSYGSFCDFCVNDDIDKMENAWWLDI